MPTTYTVYETGITASVNEAGDRLYTRKFVVKVSAAVSSLDVIQGGQAATPALPTFGKVMTTASGTPDGSAICNGLDVQQNPGSVYLWDVTASYSSAVRGTRATGSAGSGGSAKVPALSGNSPANPSSPQAGGAAGGTSTTTTPSIVEDPLSRPAKFSWSCIKVNKPLIYDLADVAIKNSAGYPFDPPLEYQAVHTQLTVSKNLAITTVTSSWIQNYVDTINNATFQGFPQYSLKINDITATSENENSTWFWATTVVFEYNPDLWYPVKVLDAGWQDSTGKTIELEFGRQPTTVPLLNGSGSKLAAGGTPVFRSFDIYEDRDFSLLGLF